MSPQTNFTITTEADLNTDLALINSGGTDAAASTAYTFTLSNSLSLTTALAAINLLGTSSLTVAGGGFTINGNSTYAGFDVASGSAIFANLTIQNTVAQGGAGGTGAGGVSVINTLQGGGGGGGAGLGGGVFVAAGASATLQNVSFTGDAAKGGAGGAASGTILATATPGGGAAGGAAENTVTGLLTGAGGGGFESGGGGGSTGVASGSAGSFGGGGGGGGGVSGLIGTGGAGGFGGGGGGANTGTAAGGFGGGNGNAAVDGGGGLGAGADVFVQTGGTLVVDSGTLGAGTVAGGTATGTAGSGLALGSGIFVQSGTVDLAPTTGQTVTVSGVVADPNGSVSGSTAGAATLAMQGTGTVVLGAANTYSGGTFLQSGTLELGVATAAGTGAVTFSGAATDLKLDTNTLSNTIAGLVAGDIIDLTALGFVNGATTATQSTNGNSLAVTNGVQTDTFTLSGLNPGTSFHVSSDGVAGTKVQIGPTAPPTITAITSSPATGDLSAGHVVLITLTPNTAVTVVGGVPTLTLNDGGTATYVPGASTGNALVFSYTIAAGQNTSALAVTSIVLNSAVITDSVGNVFNPSAALPAYSGPQIDTVGPAIASIASTPATGDFTTGTAITITLATNEAVTVTGTPTLTLNDGATATYSTTASTATALAFTYTVAAGQNVAALGITSLNLAGGTVTDAAGNALNAAALLPGYSGPKIDTTAPFINTITASPNTGTLNVGNVVTLTLTPSETVFVTGGTPTLTLNDGGTATYVASASTATALVFTYIVAANQNTSALTVTTLNDNGASIDDGAGNALNPLAGFPSFASPVINTTTPTITAIASTPATGDYDAGQVITFTLTVSETVTVSGNGPTLTLNDGGIALFSASASGGTSLVFTVTVAAGQNVAALAVVGLNLNGGTITDTFGNNLNTANPLPSYSGPQIDTTPPTIIAIVSAPATGDLDAGQLVTFTLTVSEAITLAGAPTLTLNDGGIAVYNRSASTATSLVFTYTVATGQNVTALTLLSFNLNGGSLTDGAGNRLASPPTLPAYSGPQIDTTPPTIVTIASTPATGYFDGGQVITFTLTISEAIILAGAPTLTLNDGGIAIYNRAASTATSLVFIYTVATGQNVTALTVVSFNLNGGSITDGAGNGLPNAPALPAYSGPLIDTTPPVIIAISGSPANGPLSGGQVLTIILTVSEAVIVAGGTPTLLLSDGGFATYSAGASTQTTLTFTYIVLAGQTATSLTVLSLVENGATIQDLAGNPINLSAPLPSYAGPPIQGTPTVFTAISASPASGDFDAGHTITITLTASAAVTVSGGAPTLTLNDGGIATYVASASSSTTLVFTTTIAAGQNAASLGITTLNLNGATVTVGGTLLGASAGLPAFSGPMIDTTPPTIIAISGSPATGTLGAGQVLTIVLTASEAVAVAGGTPTLVLSDGGVATYSASASTQTTLVFTYIVLAGQNTASLTVLSLAENGATINDLAGNALNLSAPLPTYAGPPIQGTPTVFTAISASPASGDFDAGHTITITLTSGAPAAVSGGVPTLTLNDGGIATYVASASSSTTLVFTTTVAAGQNATSLGVTALNLNGATVTVGGTALGASATLPSLAGPMIDTTPPTATAITSTATLPVSQAGTASLRTLASAGAALPAGAIVDLTVTMSEAVIVAGGVPTLSLNDGKVATYDAANSTATALQFDYTVGASDAVASLGVTGFNLAGAVIDDLAGNPFNATAALPQYIGPQIQVPVVDANRPIIVSLSQAPATGDLGIGEIVTITITLNEAVTYTGGVPSLFLNDGGTAVYSVSLSTPTVEVFTYTVTAGQITPALTVTAFNLNGAVATDSSGTVLGAPVLPTVQAGPQINGTGPIIIAISSTPASGIVTLGETIIITLTISEPVTVIDGVPTLTLNDGGIAVYDAASSTASQLVFTAVIAAGQNSAGLAIPAFNLNGAIIADAAGNPLNANTVLPSFSGPVIATTLPSIPVLYLVPLAATPTITGLGPANATITFSLDGGTLGTATTNGNGVFTYPLPASVPVGLDSITATATGSDGNVSAASAPLLVAIGPVLDWIQPVSGVFSTNGNWMIDGVQTQSTPNATNTAEFETGSANGYTVSGNGTAAEIVVKGDQVTTTGQLAVVGLLNSTTGIKTDLAISGAGRLTIAAGGSFTAADAVTVGGGATTATLAVAGDGTLSTLAGLTLASGGTLLLDNTAAFFGPVTLAGGTLDAIPASGGTTAAESLNNAVVLDAGTTDTAGSTGGAVLDLLGAVTGAGALTVVGNLILANAANSYSGGTVLDGGSLDVTTAGAAGTGPISSVAGTTNTIKVEVGNSIVNSNGLDTIDLGTGTTMLAVTGAASIVGGSGNATIVASGAAITVTGGSGNLAISGSADLVETAPNGGGINYTGTGRITYVGSGTGSETVTAVSGSTITTGTGANRVNLGSGSNVVTSTGTDTIQASSGADTITAKGASILVNGGSGTLYFAGGASSSTVNGGTGSATIFGGSKGGVLTGGSAGNNLVIAGGGSSTVIGGGKGDQLYGSPKGADLIKATTANQTLVAGSGAETLMGAGSDVMFAGAGATVMIAGAPGNDILVGGSGTATMTLAGGDLAFGGGGSTTIMAGSTGKDTMVGGAGTTTMVLQGNDLAFGGTGPTVITAGAKGGDEIVGGAGKNQVALAGNDLVFAGSGANVIFGSAAGGDKVVGGSGSTTVYNAAGGETFDGGAGSATVVGGSGNDVVFGGTGTGSTMFVAGSGDDEVLFQSGATTVIGGTGTELYGFNNGQAGGQDVISGFKVGTDNIALFGYGNNAVTSITSGSNGTAVTLSDGTNIQLLGVSALASNSILQ